MELSEENQQLVSQYEKERQHRKEIEEVTMIIVLNVDKINLESNTFGREY